MDHNQQESSLGLCKMLNLFTNLWEALTFEQFPDQDPQAAKGWTFAENVFDISHHNSLAGTYSRSLSVI